MEEENRQTPTTPCDVPYEDDLGNITYCCPYEDSGCSESELCRVMCGLGVDE